MTPRAHPRQQDARRGDSRHQPEDAAQQAEQAATRGRRRQSRGRRVARTARARARAAYALRHQRQAGPRRHARSSARSSWRRQRACTCRASASVSLDESRARGRADRRTPSISARGRSCGRDADPCKALQHRLRAALDPRVESLLEERDVRGRSSMPAALAVVARGSRARRARRCRPAAISTKLVSRPPLSQLAGDLSEPGPEPRAAASRCCSATAEIGSIRIGVSTLLIRQDLDASLGPALVTALRRAGHRGARRDAARAAAAAADPRHPQRPDAARQGRVRRAARTSTSTTSSASSAPPSTRSANSCRRIDRRWPARSRTSNRRSSSSRTPSRSSTRAASCCSPTPRCARCCRRLRRACALDRRSCPRDHPLRRLVRADARQPAVARAAVGAVRRQRRAAGHDATPSTIRKATSSASC